MINTLIFLDNLLNNILNFSYNNLSYLNPMLMVVALIIIYELLKDKKNILIISPIIGLFYDLIYSNYFLFNTLIFFVLGIIILRFNSKINFTLINTCLISSLLITVYDTIIFFTLVISKYTNNTIYDLLYKVSHSILINIIYIIISYLLFKKIFQKTSK